MLRPLPPWLWFAAAMFPMLASQVVRLGQTDPVAWLACDYAGRIGALAVLAVVPAAREVAFRRKKVAVTWWEIALWVIAIVAADLYVADPLRHIIDRVLPGTKLGAYPTMTGLLHFVDVTFGLALVATSEELLFRRCLRHLLQKIAGDGTAMVITTSILFGAYHWWTGIGNIVGVTIVGVLLMLFYRRAQALWPVILAHYFTDIVYFA